MQPIAACAPKTQTGWHMCRLHGALHGRESWTSLEVRACECRRQVKANMHMQLAKVFAIGHLRAHNSCCSRPAATARATRPELSEEARVARGKQGCDLHMLQGLHVLAHAHGAW